MHPEGEKESYSGFVEVVGLTFQVLWRVIISVLL